MSEPNERERKYKADEVLPVIEKNAREEIEARLAPAQAREEEARPESWEIADEIYNLVDDIRETETDPRYPNAPECERPVLSSRQSMERIEAYCRKREAALRSRQSPQATGDSFSGLRKLAGSLKVGDPAQEEALRKEGLMSAAPQPSPQGEDAEALRHELERRCLYPQEGYGEWNAGVKSAIDSFMQFLQERARLASAQSSAQGEEARPVLAEIHAERLRQDAKWGVQDHPIRDEEEADFYKSQAERWRRICDGNAQRGSVTWFNILIEEFFEAFAEDTPEAQRAEFVQVAAVAVSVIECIDRAEARAALERKETPK